MATSASSKSADNSPSTRIWTDHPITKIPHILPHERVFPVQIGTELFKLSGASLSSDAPSYFSQYFRCQLDTAENRGVDPNAAIHTLYIDRDPVTFRDISLHLQGYHVKPVDGKHFVRLFADAQFYSLPKLLSQLYEESIFISIGNREFQIPRDTFSDSGNSPNFFSLGFAVFFARGGEAFPGLDRAELIRPPSILPPSIPNRSPDIFADILRILQGYPVRIRDEVHREALLKDARYFHFKGVEQRLIPHAFSYNQARDRREIMLRLENVQKSGISISKEGDISWVNYARPFVDDAPAELVLEIGGETTRIHFTPDGPRAEFFNDTRARVTRLLEVVATKRNLSSTTPASPGHTLLSEHPVRVSLGPEAAVTLDGRPQGRDGSATHGDDDVDMDGQSRKRRRVDGEEAGTWTVKTGLWRLRIQPGTGRGAVCVIDAVKLDAVSGELGRNLARGFLSG